MTRHAGLFNWVAIVGANMPILLLQYLFPQVRIELIEHNGGEVDGAACLFIRRFFSVMKDLVPCIGYLLYLCPDVVGRTFPSKALGIHVVVFQYAEKQFDELLISDCELDHQGTGFLVVHHSVRERL